jgi:hypothetical protein
MTEDLKHDGKTTMDHRTIPGEITPERAKLLGLATKHLFDHLAHTNEKFFRKLTADSITDPEYGQIQITATANFLRYLIHTNIAAKDTDYVITQMMEGMRVAPPIEDTPEEESQIIIPGVH